MDRCTWLLTSRSGTDKQVGSHYLFTETNPSLIFDRILACGTHLDIAAGTAVRFEPGERKTISLVQVGGQKLLSGGNALASGLYEDLDKNEVLQRVKDGKYGHKVQTKVEDANAPEMDREVVSVIPHLTAAAES